MRLNLSAEIADLLDLIRSQLRVNQDLYIVGGALRDALLGRELHDLDFVCPENPTQLAQRVADILKVGFFVLDDARHTSRVLFKLSGNQAFPLDFVQFTGEDLLSDLSHRDFTINAIALHLRDIENLLDPLGGIQDLAKGLLRTCSEGSLLDDPVRVIRGVRLAMQFNFNFAPGVSQLMKQASQHLPKTSYERQRDEFFKILAGPDPASGMAACRHFGIFETLIPPLTEQAQIPVSPPHTLPLFEHTLSVVDYLDSLLDDLQNGECPQGETPWWLSAFLSSFKRFSKSLDVYLHEEITPGRTKRELILFGALLHDIGKPMTLSLGEDGNLHYYDHAQVGGDLAWDAAKRMRLSNAESNWIQVLVAYHMALLPLIHQGRAPSGRDIFRFFKDTGEGGVAISLLSLADTLGTYNQKLDPRIWKDTLKVSEEMLNAWWHLRESVINPEPFLNGNDLQEKFGLEPGKDLGKLLDDLLEAQASGLVKTERDAEKFIHGQTKRF